MSDKRAKFTDYWKTLDLELDSYFPADPIAVYNSMPAEEAHIALFDTLAWLDGEKDVVIIHPSAAASVQEAIKRELPYVEIVYSPLIRKDQMLYTKKKNLKPPVKWRWE